MNLKGYVLVPKEITDEIVSAYKDTTILGEASIQKWLAKAWLEMLAAAPTAPTEAMERVVEALEAQVPGPLGWKLTQEQRIAKAREALAALEKAMGKK